MRRRRYTFVGRLTEFFYLSLSHESLENHYRTNFSLIQHHKYSLTELDNLMPWEKEIYVGMLTNYIKEENERRRRDK